MCVCESVSESGEYGWQDWLHGKLASYSIHILHKVYNIVYTD